MRVVETKLRPGYRDPAASARCGRPLNHPGKHRSEEAYRHLRKLNAEARADAKRQIAVSREIEP